MNLIIDSKDLEWLWNHLHYPAYEKNGKFFIGALGPHNTKIATIRAARKYMEAEGKR